jgi:hypothetical protein
MFLSATITSCSHKIKPSKPFLRTAPKGFFSKKIGCLHNNPYIRKQIDDVEKSSKNS